MILGGDEGDAGADVDVTVIDLAKAGATPDEVHLADQHPVAAWRDANHLGEMADEVRALHTAGEGDRRARCGHARAVIATSPEDVGLSRVQHLWPPVTPAEAGTVDVVGRVGRVDVGVAARRDGPLADVGHKHGRALAGLAGGRERHLIGRHSGGAFAQACGWGGGQSGLARHPAAIVGDGRVADVVPVGGAVERAAGPAVAEPAVIEIIAALVVVAQRAQRGLGWRREADMQHLRRDTEDGGQQDRDIRHHARRAGRHDEAILARRQTQIGHLSLLPMSLPHTPAAVAAVLASLVLTARAAPAALWTRLRWRRLTWGYCTQAVTQR